MLVNLKEKQIKQNENTDNRRRGASLNIDTMLIICKFNTKTDKFETSVVARGMINYIRVHLSKPTFIINFSSLIN